MIAYTRAVPSSIARCECVDLDIARHQHELYEEALRAAGASVTRLPACDDLPDSVFVEDTAVVLDEIAVVTRPGAASRRDEVTAIREVLATHRTIASIEGPATLDGGDVLVLDRDVLVGLTPRTNLSGMQQLRAHLAPFGYAVQAVPVRGCLHLKSAVTRAGENLLVANPVWIDPALMPGWEVIPVDAREPFGANVLWLGDALIVAEVFVRTNAALARASGSRLIPVPAGELAKAEGGVTCCSLLLRN